MDARELKIGNHLQYFGNIVQVEGIVNESDGYGIQLSGGNFTSIKSNSLEAIPLTEEWILKFGFENSRLGKFQAIKVYDSIGYHIYFKQEHLKEIDHVHTLQNLYFALTGEELTLKNK